MPYISFIDLQKAYDYSESIKSCCGRGTHKPHVLPVSEEILDFIRSFNRLHADQGTHGQRRDIGWCRAKQELRPEYIPYPLLFSIFLVRVIDVVLLRGRCTNGKERPTQCVWSTISEVPQADDGEFVSTSFVRLAKMTDIDAEAADSLF